jgi:sarcosine oxidase subunit beta
MTAMAEESARIWDDWGPHLSLGPDVMLADFVRSGMLFIQTEIDERIESILAHMGALGVPVELLGPDELARRFPYLDASSHWPIRQPDDEDFFDETGRRIRGAIFEPDAGYVISPMLATQNLREVGERDGVRFQLGQAVVEVRRDEKGKRFELVFSDGSRRSFDVLLNASGPHSSILNRMVGCDLPIETRALRREVCAVETPADSAGQPLNVPIVGDLDSGIYFRPESAGRELVVGSLDPECDEMEWVDPDDFKTALSEEGFERQVLRMMKRFPTVERGRMRGLAGLYDVTTLDWNPILDCTEVPGYYVAIGTSGSSFKTAPVIGAVVSELIESCEGGRDHDSDPLHVTLPRTGFELDVSFFSRLRGAHTSSGTVLG